MSTERSAHPLRPYYQPDEDRSVFIASRPSGTTALPSSGSTSKATSSGSAPTASRGAAVIGSRPSNRYIRPDDDDLAGLQTTRGPSWSDAARGLVLAGALQFSSTCVAMPFEVGKLLLQIQWVPKDDVWTAYVQAANADAAEAKRILLASARARKAAAEGRSAGLQHSEWDDDDEVAPETEEWLDEDTHRRDFGADDDELSDEEDASAYFADLATTSQRPAETPKRRTLPTDASGYVVRRSVHQQGGAKPEHVLPVVVRGGVWEMIKAVARGKEGYWGLFKGALTTFVFDVGTNILTPIVTEILALFAPSAQTPLPLPYAPYPRRTFLLHLTSQLITGFALSPLDLIRTRLIAQSTLAPHRKYNGPWQGLKQILEEEGGWRTAYFHPNLFIPTLLDFTIRPALSLGAPLIIEHTLRLDPNTSPVAYALADMTLGVIALSVTLPIETIRRRLQIQPRAPWGADPPAPVGARPPTATNIADVGLSPGRKPLRALRTCVETRPRPYLGVVEAIYRIITEETSASPVPRHKREQSTASTTDSGSNTPNPLARSSVLAKGGHSSLGGVRSLYRGFSMAASAHALVFVLTLFSAERAPPSGWAEI
ncbi:mitochondrial carrier [Ceraceosorus guamensis]|uniref:Mitochondrial carrier n=1 Tax=Ceraceosorus guamensis TaxID=1522189 RepID=A0A316VWR4_9BASI|nr:mitochondrial carrier [Ceraceosorus guamensis]PWN41892.1 mitochondrial carrier [Ceraceosorus guamensis]